MTRHTPVSKILFFLVVVSLFVAIGFSGPSDAAAAEFPTKPISMIVKRTCCGISQARFITEGGMRCAFPPYGF